MGILDCYCVATVVFAAATAAVVAAVATARGSGPQNVIFLLVPKSFFSDLVYSTRCEYDILKVL
jgi:hypothetical protein